MDKRHLTDWLMENAGPAIRYRTVTELCGDRPDVETQTLLEELVNSSMTQLWLTRIGMPDGLFSFHGSHPEAFENACFKLSELGVTARVPVFDEKTADFRRDFAERDAYTGKFIVASALTRAGYGTEPFIREFLLNHLDTMYGLAETQNFEIYIDQDTYGDFPSAFRKRPLVNPEFYGKLPGIYALIALAYLPEVMKTAEVQHKINTIVDYVLQSEYQHFDDGFGVMRSGPRRYWSIGWSAHLPGYNGFDEMSDGRAKYFIQRLEMMAHFPRTHDHRWFKESLAHLEGFQQADGTYRFPGRYLREQQQGYWVTGAYPRLEENRRQRISLTIESTFRLLSIKKAMES